MVWVLGEKMIGISTVGDSTVDGNGTTPFAPNAYDSSGNATPNHYHNDDAPASWASIVDSMRYIYDLMRPVRASSYLHALGILPIYT